MNAQANTLPRWATSTFAAGTDTSPMELRELSAHVDRCNGSRGRWFQARCAVDAVHGFVAPRFVTSLVVAASVFGAVALVL
jgi:hypothetical protein